MRRPAGDLARLVGARLHGDGAAVVTGAATDSREVRAGDLFVALPGARVDGHDFVADAAARGAAAVLAQREVATALPVLLVGDSLAALQAIAAAERGAAPYRLAGITGSVAKTTTKELLAAILGRSRRVGRTRGNRNSEIGLPVELCNQPDDLDWVVAEMGMSHAGELDTLGRIAVPDALLYTVVAPVHLEFFSGIDAIAAAKAELIPHLAADGVLVLNEADPLVAAMDRLYRGRIVRYGVAGASDVWIERWHGRGLRGSSFALAGPGVEIEVDLRIAGRHQAVNLLAAAACALALGASGDDVVGAAAAAGAPPRRGEIHELESGVTVVDDSYNASPTAVAAMLDLLAATPGRRIAVLGEMLELGPAGTELHRLAGLRAAAAADVVVAVGGPGARAMAEGAGDTARLAADAAAAADLLSGLLRPGDTVLVKGSRGIGLDRLVDLLLGRRR